MKVLTEQIIKTSRLSRIMISVSTVFLVAFAAFNWAVSPQTAYLHASQQYSEINQTLQKKSLLLRKSVSIKKKKLETISQQIDELNADFFTPSQSYEFFSGLETLATQNGCYIELINSKPGNTGLADEFETGKVSFYPNSTSVRFVGGYGQIIELLKIITDGPKRLSLANLSITSSQGTQRLVCNIDITVYIREDKDNK